MARKADASRRSSPASAAARLSQVARALPGLRRVELLRRGGARARAPAPAAERASGGIGEARGRRRADRRPAAGVRPGPRRRARPGSVVLLGGEPGIGKSTLLLQVAAASRGRGEVLYVTGEESACQVRLRGERLGIREERLLVVAETDVSADRRRGRGAAAGRRSSSIRSRRCGIRRSPPRRARCPRCARRRSALLRWRSSAAVPVILIGHVTKDGSLAGPEIARAPGRRGHLDRRGAGLGAPDPARDEEPVRPRRRARPVRDDGRGSVEIANPSAALLSERRAGVPGSAVTAAREGSRSLLVEIQALVGRRRRARRAGSPSGLDAARLALLLAVLERAGLAFLAGGLRLLHGRPRAAEPAADLAIVAALVSSARGRPLPDGAVFFGEIGLLGEVRRVPAAGSRLKEAARSVSAGLSCRRAMRPMPRGFRR